MKLLFITFQLLLLSIAATAQYNIGITGFYSRAFGESLPELAKNNWNLGVILETFTESKFNPILELSYQTLPVNQSIKAMAIDNDGVFYLKDKLLNLTLSSNVNFTYNDEWKSGLNVGIGLSYFWDRVEKYYGRFGTYNFNTEHISSPKNVLPTVQCAYFLSKDIAHKYQLSLSLGMHYYPITRKATGYYEYDNGNVVLPQYPIDAQALPIRPFIKLAASMKM